MKPDKFRDLLVLVPRTVVIADVTLAALFQIPDVPVAGHAGNNTLWPGPMAPKASLFNKVDPDSSSSVTPSTSVQHFLQCVFQASINGRLLYESATK